MKLHPRQIEILAHDVVKHLAETGTARVSSVEAAEERVVRLITDDLQVEDRLNDEVREILSQHEPEMRSQGIQYHEMFKAVKQKLVRERKLIL